MDNFNDNQKLITATATIQDTIDNYRTNAVYPSFPVDPQLDASQQRGVCIDRNMRNSYKLYGYA